VKCDRCSSPATIHLTKIIDGQKKEVHLCAACAEAQNLTHDTELNLSVILQTVIGQHASPLADELARLTCPVCGIKYMEFRALGRLGCPEDYRVFHKALLPLLRRIHRQTRHVGKSPQYSERKLALHAELLDLRQQLRSAVEAEAYEEAARLRDLVKQKETAYESG
jgi:protein arginine kinase activator